MSDMIYREDAIDVLEKLSACEEYGVEVGTDEETYIGKYEAIIEIRDLPSADRPQGEWIVNMPNYESVCSVCGASETDFIYGTEMWYGLGESKFCPNCGARMKGADDE